MLIIRRVNCINTTSGICHSDFLVSKLGYSIQACLLDGHLYRVIYTRCIATTESADDEHMAARNM